ncbi:MAG: SH3 domain-containing protein [Kiritimatiellaeota bacterium]|nr:SH3 domain-containing protein [Kiritimatiellota bacterium]
MRFSISNRGLRASAPLREILIAGLLLCASAASAAEIRAVRFHTKPEHVFVNQPFELWFEVELPLGCDLQNPSLADFPASPEHITLGQFQQAAKIQRKVDGGRTTIDVLRFKSQALATVATEMTIRPRLQGMITERTGSGFFSSFFSRTVQRMAEAFTLRILALPEEGRPAHFSGAVGTLKLDAHLSATTAQVGDILTLSVSVSGDGDLRNAALPLPRHAEGFKVYPLKEKAREMSALQSEQVFIPQSTDAVEIGAIRFCYFNPVTRAYEEATAGPFRITFTEASDEPKADAVRIINTSASSGAAGQGVTLETVNHGIRRFLPLLVLCAFALAACFVFFQLHGAHTRIGIAAALLLLGIGGTAAYSIRARPALETRSTATRAEVRFAPSEQAQTLFTLHPDTPVTPIETAGDWVRIDYAGRRGWVPSRALQD